MYACLSKKKICRRLLGWLWVINLLALVGGDDDKDFCIIIHV